MQVLAENKKKKYFGKKKTKLNYIYAVVQGLSTRAIR